MRSARVLPMMQMWSPFLISSLAAGFESSAAWLGARNVNQRARLMRIASRDTNVMRLPHSEHDWSLDIAICLGIWWCGVSLHARWVGLDRLFSDREHADYYAE